MWAACSPCCCTGIASIPIGAFYQHISQLNCRNNADPRASHALQGWPAYARLSYASAAMKVGGTAAAVHAAMSSIDACSSSQNKGAGT